MADTSPGHALPSLTPLQRLSVRMHQRREAPSAHGNGAHNASGSTSSDGQNLFSVPMNSPPSPNGDENDPTSAPSSPVHDEAAHHLPGNNDTLVINAQAVSLAHLAPSLKRARKLGPQAATELDIFLAGSPVEREAHEYALALACHDKLGSLVAQLDYQVPHTLSATAKDYAWAFMLSPTITSYRYLKTPTAVLDAMRDLRIEEVPPKRETGRCTQIEKLIRRALTQCRFHIKDKVVDTFKSGPDDAIDIASLTAAIVSSTKVQPTAALYMRIAFIRWVCQEWPGLRDDDDFWLKVDEQLHEQVIEFKTPTKIQEACQMIYEADKEEYGLPDLISHPMIAAHLQDDWILSLGDKSSLLPQKTQGKKHPRGADADDA